MFLHPSEQLSAFSRKHRSDHHLNAPSKGWLVVVAELKFLADCEGLVAVESVHTLGLVRLKTVDWNQLWALKSFSALFLHVRNVLVKL